MDVIDQNDAETVGLVRRDVDLDSREQVGLNPELLHEFADRCERMGWDHITMHVMDEDLVMAHERHDDQGLYVALCPIKLDGERGDE